MMTDFVLSAIYKQQLCLKLIAGINSSEIRFQHEILILVIRLKIESSLHHIKSLFAFRLGSFFLEISQQWHFRSKRIPFTLHIIKQHTRRSS